MIKSRKRKTKENSSFSLQGSKEAVEKALLDNCSIEDEDEELIFSLWDDETERFQEVGQVKLLDKEKEEKRSISTDTVISL